MASDAAHEVWKGEEKEEEEEEETKAKSKNPHF